MCGRAYSPRFLWMWPNARICVMGGEQAAGVLATVKRDGIEAKGGQWSAEEEAGVQAADPGPVRSPVPSLLLSARIWDDGVIDPADTRARARARNVCRAERADPRAEVRRVPHVRNQMSNTSIYDNPDHELLRDQIAQVHRARGRAARRCLGEQGFVPPRSATPHGPGRPVRIACTSSAYGGAEADALTNLVFAEALSQSTFAGFIITVLVHTDMASPHLHHAGNAAQKTSTCAA
jgi:muconolactone delta-isomerase